MSFAALRWAFALKVGSPTCKAVLVALGNYADDGGRCWPSQARLAGDTELSERAVRSALAELERRRFITREERPRRPDKTRQSDLIRLVMTASSVAAEDHAAGVSGSPPMRNVVPDALPAGGAGTMRNVVPDLPAGGAGKPIIEPPSEPPTLSTDSMISLFPDEEKPTDLQPGKPKPAATDADFARFWDLYPRKVEKKAAEKLYRRIVAKREASVDELHLGATRYRAEVRDREQRFIKSPVRWLDRGCWADEPSAAAPTRHPPPASGGSALSLLLQKRFSA